MEEIFITLKRELYFRKIKSSKGITLIALVIIIIILLILAGITITQLTGSGLFEKTGVAKQKTRYVSAKEIIDLKLMEIQVDCEQKGEVYNIDKIAKEMEEARDITIEWFYNKETGKIKDGIENGTTELEGIVVSVDEYSEYKFLIGKECQITGVLEGDIKDTTSKEDFKEIKEFESEAFGGAATDDIGIPKIYTVTLHNGEETISKNIKEGDKILLDKLEKEGHIFRGWSLTENGEVLEDLEYLINSDIDFYAIYIEDNDEKNINVPPMTTNSSEVEYSSYHVGAPYKAFDKDLNTYWRPTYGESIEKTYLSYQFNNPNLCYKIKITFGYTVKDGIEFEYVFQGSNDNINWTDITNTYIHTNSEEKVIYTNNTSQKYKYYRFKGVSGNMMHKAGTWSVTIRELEFYCV